MIEIYQYLFLKIKYSKEIIIRNCYINKLKRQLAVHNSVPLGKSSSYISQPFVSIACLILHVFGYLKIAP